MLVDTNFPRRRGLGYSNSVSMAALHVALHHYKVQANYQQIIQNIWKFKRTVVADIIAYRFQEQTLLLG
jgi:homoserine kinase